LDIRVRHEADAARRFPVDFNREHRLGTLAPREMDEVAAVAPGVGMRKTIAKVEPDLAIVRVLHERAEIVVRPGSDDAVRQRKLHWLVRASFIGGGPERPAPHYAVLGLFPAKARHRQGRE